MTETEAQAHELVKRKEWSRAVELYDQLLGNALSKQISKERVVACLLGRSECCLELGRHEAVVSDCRRIIKLLADCNENNTGARARRRLVHALFSLRRFSEAEMATREWIALNNSSNSNNPEALKMLENLRTVLQFANGHKGKQQLEEEIQRSLEAWGGSQSGGGTTCTYCAMTFRDKCELRAHCATEQHQTVIMSDEGRDWRWRAPPRGHTSDSYQLCEAHAETGACRYGAQCAEAHGTDELAEWRERFEYRRMRLQRATETELYGKSYTEQLLERWVAAASPERVMRERLDGVHDSCSADLVTTVSSKCSRRDWTFILKTRRPLHAVALLQDAHRNHFTIQRVEPRVSSGGEVADPGEPDNDQEWLATAPGSESDATLEHRVIVQFRTDIYGTFRQSVVFDLGGGAAEPVLVKHLCVDVLPVTDADRIKEIKKEIALSGCERWGEDNAEIVAFSSPLASAGGAGTGEGGGEWERSLLAAYPCPRADSFTLTHATVAEKRPTRNNYRARMHELLCVEEMARYEQVARYNLTAKLRVAYSYMLAPNGTATSTAKYSHSGELFAVMPLGKDVSEDTSAGRLVLNSCATVLVGGPTEAGVDRRVVYEALIEDKGKSVIYLRLPARCVRDLQLKPDTDLTAEVQFQLNRIPYCEWHYAIDKMHDFRIIFPDTYVEPAIPWTPARQWPDGLDVRLNTKQREAVVAITTPAEIPLPPILIIGPFGTGKTYTLAQGIKQILQQRDTRVLICTHSNSAADLYIKDYLHGWVEDGGGDDVRPLRVYYHRRWVATVHPTVQKYCLIETIGGVRQFRPPTIEDLMRHRVVVVTLSISMWLSTVGLPRGHFTHILLDEAAQAMECEAIMPLALADQRTRLVLAGDHMQLSPELFSQFAKERNMHVSLLERLYDHYPPAFPCKILLCENYRAHEAIIRFTSELFYDQKLVSSGRQPRHDKFYPLTFFTTRGEDVQDRNSTAFYNNSEVYEVVERVCELRKRWPPAWGKLDDQSIGIMTPYADQVFRIRSELRKRRMGGISVERVLNVQGKQFRAVFLSTVRTRRTCATAEVSVDADVDYGFLSNSKLLNTAITRAQSLVAVVGDPVALCSIGRCRKVWERFIEICNQNKSLYGITWQLLRSQLDGVELKKTYVLNPLAPEFVPRQLQQSSEAYISRQQQQVVSQPPPPPPPQYVAQQQRAYTQPPPSVVAAPLATALTYVQQQQQAPPPQATAAPVFFIPGAGGPQPAPPPQYVPPPPPQQPPPPSTAFTVRPPPQPQLTAVGAWGATAVGYPLASPPTPQTEPIAWPPKQQQLVKQGQRSPQQQQLVKPLVLDNGLGASELQFLVQQQRQSSLADKEHIQFFHNVHFPEQRPSAHQQPGSLADLLPPGFTPADMLLAPQGHQLEWCRHLQDRYGSDAAQRFIDLLVRQRQQQQQQLQQQVQQQQQPLNGMHVGGGPPHHKPMYLRDLDTSIALVALQQRDEAVLNGLLGAAAAQQQQQQQDARVPWHVQQQQQQQQQHHHLPALPPQQQQQQSVPLYRRQGCTQPAEQHSPPPQPHQLQQQQPPARHADWQRQINAEFAAMNLGVAESLEEMLSRTYASVLRKGPALETPPPPPAQQQSGALQQQQQGQQHAPQDKVGDPFAVLRDLGQRSTQHPAAGPQLYHYFS